MFIVTTQTLENYGAVNSDGKFENGNAYWKFKGGNYYQVEDLDRPQDAMAFVAALLMGENDLVNKEFPQEVVRFTQWIDDQPDDAGEEHSIRDYYLSVVKRVSPKWYHTGYYIETGDDGCSSINT